MGKRFKYAELFPCGSGNLVKPLRMALGALIIQIKFQYSGREPVERITENLVMLQATSNIWKSSWVTDMQQSVNTRRIFMTYLKNRFAKIGMIFYTHRYGEICSGVFSKFLKSVVGIDIAITF